jgi:hypothetical protein
MDTTGSLASALDFRDELLEGFTVDEFLSQKCPGNAL